MQIVGSFYKHRFLHGKMKIILLHTLQVPYMCTLCDSTGLFEMIVGVLTTCHTQYTSDSSVCVFLFNRTTLQVFVTYLTGALYVHPLWFYRVIPKECRGFNNLSYTITWDSSICIFYLIEQHPKFLLHTLQLLFMCTLCDSTNINAIIQLVPNFVNQQMYLHKITQ